MTRRELLASSSVSLAAGMIPRALSGSTNDVDFVSALEAAAAIKAKQVSSLELTRRMIARIDKYNRKLNAFAYQMRDQAVPGWPPGYNLSDAFNNYMFLLSAFTFSIYMFLLSAFTFSIEGERSAGERPQALSAGPNESLCRRCAQLLR
jgi:hypothetical protein